VQSAFCRFKIQLWSFKGENRLRQITRISFHWKRSVCLSVCLFVQILVEGEVRGERNREKQEIGGEMRFGVNIIVVTDSHFVQIQRKFENVSEISSDFAFLHGEILCSQSVYDIKTQQ
jgi:hypothetical protein